jgi:hypothetical protein
MTTKQGQQINDKFTLLNNDISELRNEVRKSNVELRYLENKATLTNKEIGFLRDSLLFAQNESNYYKKKYEGVKNLEFVDKKARVQMKIGLLSSIVAWIAFVIVLVKS